MIEPHMTVVRKTNAEFEKLLNRDRFFSAHVKVGFLSKEGSELIIAAATNEYGTDRAGHGNSVHIPARPTVQPILHSRKLVEFVKAQGRDVLLKGMSARMALERIGLKGKAMIQANIRSNTPPPNAQSTIDAKGSSHTLIDTGRELQSVSYEVSGA